MDYIDYIERKPTNSTIMTNTTLNYSLRDGIEIGTEDYGIATLQMVMKFAEGTIIDFLLYVAKAEQAGKVDTNYVSIRLLSEVIFDNLLKQDPEVASLWNQSWTHIAASEDFITMLLDNWKNIISASAGEAKETGDLADVLFCLDLEALNIAAKMHAVTK